MPHHVEPLGRPVGSPTWKLKHTMVHLNSSRSTNFPMQSCLRAGAWNWIESGPTHPHLWSSRLKDRRIMLWPESSLSINFKWQFDHKWTSPSSIYVEAAAKTGHIVFYELGMPHHVSPNQCGFPALIFSSNVSKTISALRFKSHQHGL